MIKKYECGICKSLSESRFSKKRERFFGTRKDVRKHLKDKHKIKGARGRNSGNHKSFKVDSDLTKNTIVNDFYSDE